MTRPPAACGTDAGYTRHRRTLREAACDDCKAAHRHAEQVRQGRKRGKVPDLTAAQISNIVAAYRAGSTMTELARYYSRSTNTIRSVLRANKVSTRPPGPRPAPIFGVTDDLAYSGGWVRVGLVWRPERSDVA